MNDELKQFEKNIKRKHVFAWSPKFEEVINTNLNPAVITPIVVKTFEKLDWPVVYQDEKSVEAKREKDLWEFGNKITVTFEFGKMKIVSIPLGNEMWDVGRNSKRVKLFIHAFKEIEKSYDIAAQKELEIETEKINNLDDYEIPTSLAQPLERKKPNLGVLLIGGIITALVLGFIVAFLSIKGIYIIGVFEVVVAFALGYALKHLIKLSNYDVFDHLHYLFIGLIVVTYVSNQYFQYQIILNEGDYEPFTFMEFMKVRFEAGLTIKDLNTGWIGLLVSWVLQLVITYYVGISILASSFIDLLIERVPMEVVDFAYYLFVKEKTEAEVRSELSKMGWTKEEDQDDVFAALGAIQDAVEINRGE